MTKIEEYEWDLHSAVEEALGDSMDVDWTYATGARYVIERLRKDGYLPEASDAVADDRRDLEREFHRAHGASTKPW